MFAVCPGEAGLIFARLRNLMQIIVIAAGTLGNVLPFIGLSRELRQRGHDVLLGASRNCRQLAERESLDYVEVDTGEATAPDEPAENSSPLARWNELRDWSEQLLYAVYRLIAERYVPGKTIVVCHSFLFGARVAQDHLGVPVVTVHLQPWLFRSVHDRPWFMPAVGVHGVHRGFDWLLNRRIGKAVNQLRGELGLEPVTRLMHRWWFSPQLVIGLFPEWFAPRQPDWPANLLLAGFPRYDAWQLPSDRAAIDAFVSEGSAPLVFSQASLLKDSRTYFNLCAEIAQRAERRAILLTANPQHLPDHLPAGVRSFGFVPLSEILPRSAAFVHHGGLGSIAQCLAAGTPQMTVPRFLDQPDNSRRLFKLGVSDNLRARDFRPEIIAPRLKALLQSPSVAERCRHYAKMSQSEDAFVRIAEALERLPRQWQTDERGE